MKVKYLKATKKQTPGGYAKYIGTRDGVAKIDASAMELESSQPDTTYADYIATRPGAEKFGKHGLFTDAGVEVDLNKVSDELNNFKGTIWTVIVSIKRADASMIGFDIGERWRDMVRANRDELAKNFRIRPSSLQWYGAYHDESYHPHMHLIVYDKENRGYLDKNSIEKLKSTFAHVIFQDEFYNIQEEKTDRRNMLRLRGKDEVEALVKSINSGNRHNILLQAMLVDLSRKLKKYSGRKVYGYLNKEDRAAVNLIVDQIEKLPEIKALYDFWYEKQNELRHMYSDTDLPRIPLSENPEFKTIRNAVLRAAVKLGEQNKDGQVINVTATASLLLSDIGRIFEDQFSDNPEHTPRVDIKLKRQILEKEAAHGIKHG
jgi:hypothetical protein